MSQAPKTVISGVLLLNKPEGISSHSALVRAKHLLKSDTQDSKKAGHTGTLDPMATGLLPLCFGEATKFAQYGLDSDKSYIATIFLGVQTDTADKQGVAIATAKIPEFDQALLDVIAVKMTGEQEQIPPMYSALKKDGKKLYEYARSGIQVARTARAITIHNLILKKVDCQTIALSVSCSKGTYVRVLAEGIAARLGTLGHLIALHRTQTGGFDVKDAICLGKLGELPMSKRLDCLLPIDALMTHLPILKITDDECTRLQLGQRLNIKQRVQNLPEFDGLCLVRLYAQDRFVGLGELAINGRLQPKKMLSKI